MKISDYSAGSYKQQYQYKSFAPEPVNHAWEIDDPEIQQLLSDADRALGELNAFEGKPVEGIEHFRKAFRLNPYPPGWYYWLLGLVEYAAGQYEAAVKTLNHESTHRLGSQRILAASLAYN